MLFDYFASLRSNKVFGFIVHRAGCSVTARARSMEWTMRATQISFASTGLLRGHANLLLGWLCGRFLLANVRDQNNIIMLLIRQLWLRLMDACPSVVLTKKEWKNLFIRLGRFRKRKPHYDDVMRLSEERLGSPYETGHRGASPSSYRQGASGRST